MSILGTYEMYLLTRRDTGIEEGLAFFPKDMQCMPSLDELALEQLQQQEEAVQIGEDIIKDENTTSNDKELDDVINTLSSPSLLPSILKLPPTLSITPCSTVKTICNPTRTPSLQYTTPSMTHADVSGALLALTETKQLHDENSNQVEMVTIKAVSKDGHIATSRGDQVTSLTVSKDKRRKRSLCTLCSRFFTPQYLQKHQETMHGQVNQDNTETAKDTPKKNNQEGDKDNPIPNNVSGYNFECYISSDDVQVGRKNFGRDLFKEPSEKNIITEHLSTSVSHINEFDEDMVGMDIINDKIMTRNSKKIQGPKEKRQKPNHSSEQLSEKEKLKEISKDEDTTEEKSCKTSSIKCEDPKSHTTEPAEMLENGDTVMDCDKSIFYNISDRTSMKINDEELDFLGDLQREGEGPTMMNVSDSHIPGKNSGSTTVIGGNLDNTMTRRSRRLMKIQKKAVDIDKPFEEEVSSIRREITRKKSVTSEERNSRKNDDRAELSKSSQVKLVFKAYDSDSQTEVADIIKVSESSISTRISGSPLLGELEVHGNLHERDPLYLANIQQALTTVQKRAGNKDDYNMDTEDKAEVKSMQDTEAAKVSDIQRSVGLIDVIHKSYCQLPGGGTDNDDNIDDEESMKKVVISKSLEGIACTTSSPLRSYVSGLSGIEPKSPKPVPPVYSVNPIHQNVAMPLPQVTELGRSVVVQTQEPLVSSPRQFKSPARISFIVEAQGSLIPKGKSRRTFNFSMKPNAPLIKGLLAVEEKLKAVDLEFVCEGKVLTGTEQGQEVEGKTVFVRSKEASPEAIVS